MCKIIPYSFTGLKLFDYVYVNRKSVFIFVSTNGLLYSLMQGRAEKPVINSDRVFRCPVSLRSGKLTILCSL